MENFTTDQFMRVLFLVLLLVFILLTMGGGRMLKSLRQMSVWALIFVGVVAGFGVWTDMQDQVPRQSRLPQITYAEGGRVEVSRSFNGHYYLTLEVNGAPVAFVVDTGATGIVLTQDDARRAGFEVDRLNYFGRANTANGEVRTAPVRIDEMSLGGIVDRNVTAYVNGGQMEGSLLGMGYLQRWGRIEIADGKLILTR